LFVALLCTVPAPVRAATSGVVLAYHHVSNETPDSTSVDPDTFEAHMQYLAEHGFHVWPLPKLVEALQAGREVPDRTVALTFDDAYHSVYSEAYPRLRERGWPFTVFVSPGYIDGDYSNYVSWGQLREMERNRVTIANHSLSHPHLVHRREGESADAWRRRVRHEIAGAQERLGEQLDHPAKLLAYPFGEFDPAVESIARELGFVGFGQQSGAFGRNNDFAALPRFPIATGFASLDTFALKVRSRPLPVVRREPESGMLGPDAERPALRLTLGDGPYRAEALRCYVGGKPAEVEQISQEPVVLEVRAAGVIGSGRTKYNCTAPATDADVWYWYSFLWMKPLPDGSWYRD